MGEERVGSPPKLKEIFKSVFPYYLSIGMTYDQFWNEDVCLVKYYREADEMRNGRRNREMWLQGLYFTSALNASVGNLFSKKGAQPIEYLAQPIPITRSEIKERQRQQMIERAEGFRALAEAKQTEKALKEADNGNHN